MNVTTDKARYSSGDAIEISVTNDLDEPVWYAKKVECGLGFWRVETCAGAEVICRMPCQWVAPQHDFSVLAPGETLTGQWGGTVEDREGARPAKAGCYVIVVPYFTSEPDPTGAYWAETVQEATCRRLTIR